MGPGQHGSAQNPSCAFLLQRELDLHHEAEHSGKEFLWLWEAHQPSAILGRSGKLDTEVNIAACEKDAVPVLRRQSGGGAVLLASGCLNYTLILNLERRPHLRDIEQSYQAILQSIIRAAHNPGMQAIGSDLTLLGRKFGGCSQKR